MYQKRAAAGALEATVDPEGSPKTDSPKVALKQQRPGADQLRQIWLSKVGWPKASAAENWKAAGGDGTFDPPKAGGKTCDMDHIVELQVHGSNAPENIQVLDLSENRSSGSQVNNILIERARAIREVLPDLDLAVLRYEAVVQKGSFCGPCCKIEQKTLEKMQAEAKPSKPVEGVPYPISVGGSGATLLADKDTANPTLLFESDVVANRSGATIVPGMLLLSLDRKKKNAHTIAAKIDDRPKTGLPLTLDKSASIQMKVGSTGALSLANTHPDLKFHYPYLSEGRITSLSMGKDGLSGKGELTPSIPLLGGMTVKIEFSPTSFSIVGKIPTEKLKTPIPGLKIKKADLSLLLHPEFSASGTMDVAIGPANKPFADGTLRAAVENNEFVATGDFALHIPGVDSGTLNVSYRKSTGWKGEANLTTAKPPISEAHVHVTMSDKGLAVGGGLKVDLPGGNRVGLDVDQKEVAGLVFRGEADLKVPKLDDVHFKFVYSGNHLTAKGHAKTTFLGATGTLDLTYQDGDISGTGKFHIKKGRAEGDLIVTMSPAYRFSGKGSVTFQVSPNLITTVGLEVDENGKTKLSGAITFPKPIHLFDAIKGDYKIFEAGISIPIPALSVGAVGVNIRIEGGLSAGYAIGPGELQNTKIEGSVNPFEETPDLDLMLSSHLSVPADAHVTGNVSASVELSIGIASADAGLNVKATAALTGGFFADPKVHYQKSRITVDIPFKASLELILTLALDAFVRAQAGFGPFKVATRKDWQLASFKYNPGLRLGIEVPLHYASDEPFQFPSTDQIKFTTPTIDPAKMISNLFDSTTPSEKQL
jgi:hypothetical protein